MRQDAKLWPCGSAEALVGSQKRPSEKKTDMGAGEDEKGGRGEGRRRPAYNKGRRRVKGARGAASDSTRA